MEKFSYKIEKLPHEIELHLAGVIDVDFKIDDPNLSNIEKVTVDFDMITGINSLGTKNWISFLQRNDFSNLTLVYKKCRPGIVDQLNMTRAFMPNQVKVESFYADYVCEQCENEDEVLFLTETFNPNDIPDHTCCECAAAMEFEGDEDNYFLFLETV